MKIGSIMGMGGIARINSAPSAPLEGGTISRSLIFVQINQYLFYE
jgi:hypothetical protein